MKKILYILWVSFFLVSASCTKDEDKLEQPVRDGYRIELTGNTRLVSRVSIGEKDGDIYPLLWTVGDVISIYSKDLVVTEAEDGGEPVVSGNINGETAELFSENSGQTSGVFQTSNTFSLDEDEDIVILYPASSMTYNGGKISRTVSNVQEQLAANSSVHVGQNVLSYAETTLGAGQTEGVNFNLSQKTAFVKLILSTTEFADLNLVGAKLYAPGNSLSGKVEYDIDAEELTVVNGNDNVGVTLRNPVPFKEAQSLYFTALPCDLTGQEVYVVISMKNDEKTVTIPAKISGGKLEASKLSVITIEDISLSTNQFEWYEPVETRYVAAYGEGWSYGPANCFVAYFDGEAVTFDVKARGNFAKCTEPAALLVHNACEANINNKTNLIINGINGYDGSQYVKIPLNGNYQVAVQALAAGTYTGYSSKVKLLDKNDNCIWCFNIWGNKDQLMEQTYVNGVMLDRNIGADGSKVAGKYVSGSYYQWGRPFQTGWSSSGGLFDKAASYVTDLSISAAKPEVFFHMEGVDPSQGGDWYLGAHTGARTEHLDDLWGNPNLTGEEVVQSTGTKSIYDPCPPGYMAPSPMILNEMVNNITVNTSDANSFYFAEYALPDKSIASWPFSGCKWGSNGGNCDNNKSDIVACWSNASATSYEQQGANAYVFNYRYKNGAFQAQNGNRSHGYPVRCQKDPDNR